MSDFLGKAEKLASMIFQKSYEISRKPMKDVSLGSMLSILNFCHSEEGGSTSIVPKIHEIILFGSVATGEKNPGDIDLMVLDNGHFSNFFPCMAEDRPVDAYEDLGENLVWLMEGWFNVSGKHIHEILEDTEVDLHVLPINFLKSQDIRRKITSKHKDPEFFKNALRKALRFDTGMNKFIPVSVEYLEEKYHCDLDDISV